MFNAIKIQIPLSHKVSQNIQFTQNMVKNIFKALLNLENQTIFVNLSTYI